MDEGVAPHSASYVHPECVSLELDNHWRAKANEGKMIGWKKLLKALVQDVEVVDLSKFWWVTLEDRWGHTHN